MGIQPDSPKGGGPPQFLAHFYCDQTVGCIKMPLGTDVGLSPFDFVLDGDPLPSPKGGGAPLKFSVHIYCGQTAGWINIALGMEVGLGPLHIVLDGDTAPLPKKGGRAPQFSAHLYCGQTSGCIKVPLALEVGLSLGDCVRWGLSTYPKRGGAPPNFRPTSIVAKRLHGSRCHLVRR